MTLSLTEIQAITEDFWESSVTDIYFTDNVLLYLLLGNGKMAEDMIMPNGGETTDGGQMIRVPLEYAESNSGAYGKNTEIVQAKTDILNAARFRWGGYWASNSIDLDDKVQNTGKAAKVNLVFAKLRNIQKTIRKTMGAAIYAQDSSGIGFLGLGDLFYATTSTAYGSIAEADMAEWKANNSSSAMTMSFSSLQEVRRTAAVGQSVKNKPNLYITTDELKDAFENSLQASVRYSDRDLVNAGFDNILFKGAPVVSDTNQTANYVDALNTRFLKIRTHKDYRFTKPVWEHDKTMPDKEVANTRWIGQFVCSNRKAHARYTNFSA